MKRTLILILLLTLVVAPAAAGEPLTLMLDWFPNVDHLPIYVAQARGFFQDAGIAVEIMSPSDTADGLKLAAAGRVDLAVSYQPQTVMAAAEGLSIRVVGRLVGAPLTTLLFLKSKGYRQPSDLSGTTIGYTVPGLMDGLMRAMARINGIENYKLVNVGFGIVPALTAGEVDAVMGPFKTYETVTMAAQGLEARYFELERWGIPAYDELIFICGPQAYAAKQKALQSFVTAVARGIAFQRDHPEEALALYFKAVPDADRETETAAFGLTRPYFAGSQVLDAARWQQFADFALKYELIDKPVDVRPLLVAWPQ